MTGVQTRNPNHFVNHIVDWAANKPLLQIYAQIGAWEGWTQIWFSIAIPQSTSGSTNREFAVYADGESADVLDTAIGGAMMIIELMLQSSYQDQVTVDALVDVFIFDIDEIDYTAPIPRYQNVAQVVNGITLGSGHETGIVRAIQDFSIQPSNIISNPFGSRRPTTA